MATSSKLLGCVTALLLGGFSLSQAQTGSPAPAASAGPAALVQAVNPTAKASENSAVLLVQASLPSASPAARPPSTTSPATTTTTIEPDNLTENGGVGVREFQGDDVGQVLRLLARQAKINVVVSEAVTGTVTMRLEDVTALQAISVIVKAKALFMDKIDNVYYVKTATERTAEPTEQVMIEARLVEVTANPKQSYGINWAGVVGSSSSAKTFTYGAPTSSSS